MRALAVGSTWDASLSVEEGCAWAGLGATQADQREEEGAGEHGYNLFIDRSLMK